MIQSRDDVFLTHAFCRRDIYTGTLPGREHEDARQVVVVPLQDDDGTCHLELPRSYLQAHESAVTSLSLSLDAKILLSAGRDKVAVIWNLQTWKKQATILVFEAIEGESDLSKD